MYGMNYHTMKNLFENVESEIKAVEKFEKLFDTHTNGDILYKTADLYLTLMEESGIECDVNHIIEIGENYGYNLDKLQDQIDMLQ